MTSLLEQFIAQLWNRRIIGESRPPSSSGLNVGSMVVDGQTTSTGLVIPQLKRAEHIAILGKTGTGKSSLLRHLTRQDIERDQGFIHFDLHGDSTSFLLKVIAEEERRRHRDLSERLIVVEPGDPTFSVGLNVLEQRGEQHSFVQIAEFAQILKQRWHLDSFGARTEELLRNTLFILVDNGLTLLELGPLLTNLAFRSSCLRRVRNPEVRAYFESRYDRATEAMQAVFRDPVLNKVSGFTADPRFRHIVGQRQSTFSLADAIDQGFWVILNLDKGRLGEQAATLGSLFLARLKNALFGRKRRSLCTLYCDELQNLVAYDTGIDTLLSEARKFGISICSANQFLDQYPPQMRSAILAVSTHIFFQLSSNDADKISAALDGGKGLNELLKNLPQRQMILKSGHYPWRHAAVPDVSEPRIDYSDLYERCRRRWARGRAEVEREIEQRHRQLSRSTNEVLNDWE